MLMVDHPLMLADGELILYVIAVIGFAITAAIINKVQRWWAKVNQPASRRPVPPGASPPRTPGRPPRPVALPRPVIRESLPDLLPPSRPPPKVRGPAPPPRTARPSRPAVPQARARPPVPAVQAEPARPVAPAPAAAPQSLGMLASHLAEIAQARTAPAVAPVSGTLVTGQRRVSGGISREELRRAIVLNELLSPPLALREM